MCRASKLSTRHMTSAIKVAQLVDEKQKLEPRGQRLEARTSKAPTSNIANAFAKYLQESKGGQEG
jgi:hypothetical protein